MPGYQLTQGSGTSDSSSNNDGNSTNFTGSDQSTHRPEAPEEPTLGERVFNVYMLQEITESEDLPIRIMRSSDNNESYIKFSGLYGMYEEELVAEEGGPISRY